MATLEELNQLTADAKPLDPEDLSQHDADNEPLNAETDAGGLTNETGAQLGIQRCLHEPTYKMLLCYSQYITEISCSIYCAPVVDFVGSVLRLYTIGGRNKWRIEMVNLPVLFHYIGT